MTRILLIPLLLATTSVRAVPMCDADLSNWPCEMPEEPMTTDIPREQPNWHLLTRNGADVHVQGGLTEAECERERMEAPMKAHRMHEEFNQAECFQ